MYLLGVWLASPLVLYKLYFGVFSNELVLNEHSRIHTETIRRDVARAVFGPSFRRALGAGFFSRVVMF